MFNLVSLLIPIDKLLISSYVYLERPAYVDNYFEKLFLVSQNLSIELLRSEIVCFHKNVNVHYIVPVTRPLSFPNTGPPGIDT